MMGIQQSKIAKKLNTEPTVECVFSSPEQERYFNRCVPLHKAALKGDWDAAEVLIAKDSTLIRTPITGGGETALHIAAVEGHENFVSKLLDLMDETDLEIGNVKGGTALCFAAATGQIATAKCMMKKNAKLATIRGENGITPLYMAVVQGYEEMAEYLYPLSNFEAWTPQDQIALLTRCIDSGLYGLAMDIVNKYKTLAIAEDDDGETPLQVLARKPLAFSRKSDQGIWGNIINTILPNMMLKARRINAPRDAYTLLGCLWNNIISLDDTERTQVKTISRLSFKAAESGNDGFLVELFRQYPDFLYMVNETKCSILHIAILHRCEKVFNLLHEFRGVKDLIATYVDNDGNNILHLAGKRAPAKKLASIPGVALQMQREVLWYKEVVKVVQPMHRNMKNFAGQTPYDVFLSEHEDLMKEGEKLIKQTAKSCMLIAMLIATVAFTTAVTAPCGYFGTSSDPILETWQFLDFQASEALARLSSLISMFTFLSILMSRYSSDHFLKTQPFWLVIGVTLLFISIVAMMVLFCTCLLSFHHGWPITAVLLVFFACVPVMFVVLKYPLLVTVLRYMYSCSWLFRLDSSLHV